MPNVYDGTHMFIWQVDSVLKGNVDDMIQQAKQLGLTGVIIKFANGSLAGDSVSQKFMADFKRVAPVFKQNGFKVGGWIYQYMTDPQGEAEACFEAIEAGADWIVLDGEIEVKGKENEIAQFGKVFREKYPNYPLGLSSFAITNYHSEVPFDTYNKYVNFYLPQIYWADMEWEVTNAFNVSVDSYRKFNKPILPTGQSYANASSADVKQFVQLCKNAGFTHVSWWDWQHATSDQLAGVKNNLILPPKEEKPIVKTSKHFVDIPDSLSWIIDDADELFESGILVGDGQGHLNPSQPATRADMVALIARLKRYTEKEMGK